MARRILVVDDKRKVCESLVQNFETVGYDCFVAHTATQAIAVFVDSQPSAAIVDMRLGGDSGIDVLSRFKELDRSVPVIMITAYADVQSAVESIKIGAFDYVQKPIAFDKLSEVVNNAIRLAELREENDRLRTRIHSMAGTIVTQDSRMLAILEKAERFAPTELPILLLGESGTGKELLAEFIHSRSTFFTNDMVKINCSAFTESLLNSELFGHEKGAFTGADSSYRGVFEQAHESTLFLDEVGDMPYSTQTRILRTIQDKRVRRVGGSAVRAVNMRIVTATNKPIEELVSSGEFREDLYYRLNTVSFHIPPLRDRSGDIPILAENLLHQFNRDADRPLQRFDGDALRLMVAHDWPGNVRELRNVVQYASAISDATVITLDDLPPAFASRTENPKPVGTATDNVREKMERELIIASLKKFDNNKSKSAAYLGMSRKTLYAKIERYGIG